MQGSATLRIVGDLIAVSSLLKKSGLEHKQLKLPKPGKPKAVPAAATEGEKAPAAPAAAEAAPAAAETAPTA